MTRPEDRIRIQHALDAARKAVSSTTTWDRSRLDGDDLATLGLIRLLEIVGEAGNSVSLETRDRFPNVPWRQMVGLRNRLVHGYFNVNLDVVWDTIRSDLPDLIVELERVLESSR